MSFLFREESRSSQRENRSEHRREATKSTQTSGPGIELWAYWWKAKALALLHQPYLRIYLFIYLFIPFYWAGFVVQRERAQQDFKVPYKVPHLNHPPFTYERQPQHRDHPTLIRIVRGFFNVPQNYQHSRNCETGPPVYRPYPRRLESLTICR